MHERCRFVQQRRSRDPSRVGGEAIRKASRVIITGAPTRVDPHRLDVAAPAGDRRRVDHPPPRQQGSGRVALVRSRRLHVLPARLQYECYDLGYLYTLARFADRGFAKPPFFIRGVFGILGGIGADVRNLSRMVSVAEGLFGDDYILSIARMRAT
jgi:hypothetical protein